MRMGLWVGVAAEGLTGVWLIVLREMSFRVSGSLSHSSFARCFWRGHQLSALSGFLSLAKASSHSVEPAASLKTPLVESMELATVLEAEVWISP